MGKKVNKKGSRGFEKIYYRGKEVKPKPPKLVSFELEMPKKLKGYKIIFPISFGYGERTQIIVENTSRIKKIVVYGRPANPKRGKTPSN